MNTTEASKNRGGRPPLPRAPESPADCRRLIAQEVVRTKPSDYRLRQLHKLLRAFEKADAQAAADLNNRLLEEANRLRREDLALKRAEYQRRYALGQQTKARG
jgi:hypothetical protein